jgi:hypothetical protein
MSGEERRRVPRYPFIASAELVEVRSDVRVATRVSELSLGGCYLDMMNPFPMGTRVLVKISEGDEFFEAASEIVYKTEHLGVGVRFLEIEPIFLAVLMRWLDRAEKDRLRQNS